ncbi:MAG: hypothetical protein NC548_46795 [Lachnospiraceae bacterium]|nr:hypothetical protein [Lachnospiraceae bacterium]MCM1232875.1 hypothetical protein [Ruminococcus flavefaciens]
MVHKLVYAADSNDADALGQFNDRLALSGIQTKQLNTSDRYSYFEAVWDDADIPAPKSSHSKNAGAKPKPFIYNGKPVDCGFIYQLRNIKNLSDAEIGLIFDVSESTVARRRKKHLSDGSFYEDSTVLF